MNRATPQMRHFAKCLIVYERRGDKSARTKTPAGFFVQEKLRPQLASLMGDAGYRALAARALTLAAAEIPWLRGVQIKADGTLAGLGELSTQLAPDEFFEGRVVVLAQLLGLLVAFIGEDLTLRLVREIWPNVPLDNSDIEARGKNETRGKNEKTKQGV